MRRPRFSLALIALLAATGCKTLEQRIESVLVNHRGSSEYLQSQEAFSTLMREFTHGMKDVSADDMNALHEQYLTLDEKHVQRFLTTQACKPKSEPAASQYYLAHAAHRRHDDFYEKGAPHPMTGVGKGKTEYAAFSATLLFERYPASAKIPPPPRAKTGPFPSWAKLTAAMSERAVFDKTFTLSDKAQADAIFAATSSASWSEVEGDLFMAPHLFGDSVFSPALFAIYLLRPSAGADYAFYVVVSASGSGDPQSPYVGLLPQTETNDSVTGFAFSYLSAADNVLKYGLRMPDPKGSEFQVSITVGFPDRPSPYITVDSSFHPVTSKLKIDLFKDTPGAKIVLLIRKAALMRDLIASYYPDHSSLQLWKDVGALKGKATFKKDLEAIGLNLAADLFEADLWSTKPTVLDTGAPAPFTDLPVCED